MTRRLPRPVTALLAGTALGAAIAIGGFALAAQADEPLDLGGAAVVDTTGKAGDLAPVEQAVKDLAARSDLRLTVVYVSSFADQQPGDDCAGNGQDCEWADETASKSGLDDSKEILLAIAIDDRQQLISLSSQTGLSDDQLDAAEQDDLVPALDASDWTGAAVAYAKALGDLTSGTSTGSQAAVKGKAFDWDSALPWLIPLVVIAAAAIIWIVIAFRYRYLRGRRS